MAGGDCRALRPVVALPDTFSTEVGTEAAVLPDLRASSAKDLLKLLISFFEVSRTAVDY